MSELEYNIKYPEYNFNYHIDKNFYYHCTRYLNNKCSCLNCATTSLLSKYKKNSFENKCTQTENSFSNNSDSSPLGSPLTRLNSISGYDSDEKKEEEYNKTKLKIEKVERNILAEDIEEEKEYNKTKSKIERNILVEDVEEEKEFIKVNKKIMSVKEIEKYIFINNDDERILYDMPEEYQEMKRVYMEIME